MPLLSQLVRWQAQWAWDYGVQRKPYDEAAQEYLTRQAMRLTPEAWEAMDEQQRAEAVARKLWIPENQKASSPPGPVYMCLRCWFLLQRQELWTPEARAGRGMQAPMHARCCAEPSLQASHCPRIAACLLVRDRSTPANAHVGTQLL